MKNKIKICKYWSPLWHGNGTCLKNYSDSTSGKLEHAEEVKCSVVLTFRLETLWCYQRNICSLPVSQQHQHYKLQSSSELWIFGYLYCMLYVTDRVNTTFSGWSDGVNVYMWAVILRKMTHLNIYSKESGEALPLRACQLNFSTFSLLHPILENTHSLLLFLLPGSGPVLLIQLLNGWWARKRKRKKHSHCNVMPGRAPVSPATQANTLRRQGRRQQRSLLTGAVLPL